MKKSVFVILTLLFFSAFTQATCFAAVPAGNPINVGAFLPAGALSYTIHQITDPKGAVWGPEVFGFNFGTLEEIHDSLGKPLGVFASQGSATGQGIYFVVDLAVTGGAFPPSIPQINVTFQATDGTSAPAGLWTRATATYKQAVFQGVGVAPKENNVFSTALTFEGLQPVPSSVFSGGWARLYVGIVTDPKQTTPIPMPSDANVFTATDASKTYSGTFQFSGF